MPDTASVSNNIRQYDAPPNSGKLSSIEMFAGGGGLLLGGEAAGISTKATFERDSHSCVTLRKNLHKFIDVHESDVRDIDFSAFGGVDVITGGPPCQPFSSGGKGLAYDDQRDMFPQAVRAVREARPRAFIFENVKGLTRSAFKDYFSYIVFQMSYPTMVSTPTEDWKEHYQRLKAHTETNEPEYVVKTQLVNAADFGVPQQRHRIFFVGIRSDIEARWEGIFQTHSLRSLAWNKAHGSYWDRHEIPVSERMLNRREEAALRKMKYPPLEMPWKTVRDTISDLPAPCAINPTGWENHVLQKGARSYPGHTGSLLDEPSKALKAGVHGVPGGENMIRLFDGSVRYFTIREAARIQTFPDTHVLHGSWSEAMRQLGNAVPVELARVVCDSVCDVLK